MADTDDLNKLLEAADAAEKAGDKDTAKSLAAIWLAASKADEGKKK